MERPKRSAPAGLPYDALLEILARLPVKSVYRSKCVAKAWRDLVDDPLNRKKLPQTLEGFFFLDKPDIVNGGDVEHFGFITVLPRPVPLDIDLGFSFLTKLPEMENLTFLDSCNGLLLFVHARESDPLDVFGYVVCNPATKQWEAVPACGCCVPMGNCSEWSTLLAFDPAVSSHFHLICFSREALVLDEEAEALEGQAPVLSVCACSSGIGMWSRRSQTEWNSKQGQLEGWRHQGGKLEYPSLSPRRAFVNGLLHLIVFNLDDDKIVAVDVQGKTQRIITVPAPTERRRWNFPGYIGQSQGLLHYINLDFDDLHPEQCHKMYIWVLQGYDTREWALKDTVSFLELFGKKSCTGTILDCDVVAVHQDCNVVFFLQSNRLIAYDMDRKEVTVVATFENEIWVDGIAPCVPNFTESPVLRNKH
ncbi:unnamed protein product [Urochloa decumbens]|uniref:F-box domain-containing protein n=1 Tax=Urochloa decumbens TaxID=240449 RepID=A0ABC9BXJ8_9POAL